MTRDEAKKLLPVIQAFADGKDVQEERIKGKWETRHDPSFYSGNPWRIKPEPLECWVTEDAFRNRYVHRFFEDAETYTKFGPNKPHTIHHMREVI